MVHLSIPRISLPPASVLGADGKPARGNWTRQLDFLLSCLGYAVGLGNVWRFPHLSYTNGGGAFFIPYFLMVIFVGMPIFFLELSIGQFSSSGPVTAYRFCPLFTGVGMGMVTVSALVCMYYNVIIAWALYYFFASFQKILPWSGCDHVWNTPMCSEYWPRVDCDGSNETKKDNGTCYKLNDKEDKTAKFLGLYDTDLAAKFSIKPVLSSEEYFFNKVLNVSPGFNDIGSMNWLMLLYLVIAWAIVYGALFKGVKSSGKVVYFTALFPYVVLLILFVRGLTLKGAGEGVKYYLTPVWSKLLESEVWSNAGSQIFFSLSICWGGLMTLASYNTFHNNILRDTLVVTIGNCLTSIFAGFVIYSYIGHLAHTLGVKVENLSDGGTGLTFIIFPAAVLTMPLPQLWSVLFFIMLLTLGLDSQFTLVETITTMLFDVRPKWRAKKPLVTLACVIAFMIPGILLCTQGGIYLFDLLDSYSAGFNVIILCLFELFSVLVLYGYDRFASDIELMIGKKPAKWWIFCWKIAGPLILVFMLAMNLINIRTSSKFPPWAQVLGWMITLSVILWIPIVAIYRLVQADGNTILQRLKNATKANVTYGPELLQNRQKVSYVPHFVIDTSLAPKRMEESETKEETTSQPPSVGSREPGEVVTPTQSKEHQPLPIPNAITEEN